MSFFRDLWILTILDFKRYYTWSERIVFDVLLSIIGFLSFVLVWQAVFKGGFEGIGPLTKDNFIVFILSGSIVWEFISVNLTGDGIWAFIREKYQGTLPYLLVSPANKLAFVYSKVMINLFKILINVILSLFVAFVFFDINFNGSILLAIFSLLLIFVTFSGIGIVIASLGAWREGIANVSFVLGSILYLVSGVYYPIEIFPETMQKIFFVLPTTQSINLLREIVINNASFLNVFPILSYLLIWGIALIILGLIIFKKLEKKISLLGI
ncbi:ABC transporter permease [Candidatus Woesearchaeota archaeon]|nr:ABC transporter permease [Candidatus Woesearchaeota archaeon]